MSPSRTHLEATEVASAAARLALRADQLKDELAGPTEAIRSIHTAEPWGHDEYGEQFRGGYLDGGEEGGGAENILGACDGICDVTNELGENAGVSAIASDLVDEDYGRQFANAADQMDGMVDDLRESAQAEPVEQTVEGGGQEPVAAAGGAASGGAAVAAAAGGVPAGGGQLTGTGGGVRASMAPQLGARFQGRLEASTRYPGHWMVPASHQVFASPDGEHRLAVTTHELVPEGEGGDQDPASYDEQPVRKPAWSSTGLDSVRNGIHEARQAAFQEAYDAYLADHPALAPDGSDPGGGAGAAAVPGVLGSSWSAAPEMDSGPVADRSGDSIAPVAEPRWRRDLIDPAAD